MKPSPELLTQASRCRFCHGDLLALGAALPPGDDDLDALLAAVVASHEPLVMTNLMMAALAVDRPLDAQHLTTGAEQFDDIGTMITIAGHCRGELAAAMLEALRSGHMGWEREALALIIAAWHCQVNTCAWPEGLITEARVLARRVITPEARNLLYAAAHLLGDDDLWDILDPEPSQEIRRLGEISARNLILNLELPVLDAIPELPLPVVLQGGTIQRAVARVGRNEPCPCGSGKKYKRCCLEQDLERLRDSSEIAGVTRQEQRESPEVYLTEERLWEMRAHDVVALDPALIPSELYDSYINCLNLYDEFEAVLAFLEVNGVQDAYEEHIVDSIEQALSAQKPEMARRLAAHVPEFKAAQSFFPLSFRFARDRLEHGPALKLVESAALENLDKASPTDFICQLIDIGCPALGILAGRGAIAYSDLWEAETVLNHVLEARDRLDLPPADFAEDLFEQRLVERASAATDTGTNVRNTAEYEQLQAASTRAQELEKKLTEKERALKTAQQALARKQQPNVPKATVPDTPAITTRPNPEVAELQSAIVDLKQEVKRNHQDRNRYRRKFKTAVANREAAEKENQAVRSELEARLAATEAFEDDAPELLLDEAVATSYPVRVPVFADRFTAVLGRLPEAAARKAVHLSGRLAAGEEAAFQGAKRLAANRMIIRQRLGVYRLLFRLEATELVVLECVHRRELEKAVGRYS
jgi:mRNA-degrading endonuclease RelE of RelBE toxin-antitoxin system